MEILFTQYFREFSLTHLNLGFFFNLISKILILSILFTNFVNVFDMMFSSMMDGKKKLSFNLQKKRKKKTLRLIIFFPFLSSLFSSKWSDPSFTYFSYFLFWKPKALQKCFINYMIFWGLYDSLIVIIFSPIFMSMIQTPPLLSHYLPKINIFDFFILTIPILQFFNI